MICNTRVERHRSLRQHLAVDALLTIGALLTIRTLMATTLSRALISGRARRVLMTNGLRTFAVGWIASIVFVVSIANAQETGVVYDHRRISRRTVITWKAMRERNVVLQQKDYSCGAAALATLMRYTWNRRISERAVMLAITRQLSREQLKDRIENGLTLTDLKDVAEKFGFVAIMGERTLAELLEAKIPVLLRIKSNDFEHFVVYRGFAHDRIYIADPIRGNYRLPMSEFRHQWTDGVVMVVVAEDADEPPDTPLFVSRKSIRIVQPELQVVRRILGKF